MNDKRSQSTVMNNSMNDIVNKKKGHNIVKDIMNGIMNNIVNDKEGHSIVNYKQLCL